MTQKNPSSTFTEPRWLLACNAKEERNVMEWIQHHLQKGFHHILFFDDGSTVFRPEQLCESMSDEEKQKVTFRRCKSRKLSFMQKALEFSRQHDYTYLLYLDLDEYIFLHPQFSVISEYIDFVRKYRGKEEKAWHSLTIPWVMFGSSFHSTLPHPSQLLPFYHHCHPKVNEHVKHLIHVPSVQRPLSPHHYQFRPSIYPLHIWNVKGETPLPNQARYSRQKQWDVSRTPLFIAHFHIQCWEEFCRRRCRPRDDTGECRSYSFLLQSEKGPPAHFHKDNNEVFFTWSQPCSSSKKS